MNRKLVEKARALLSKERGTVFKDPGGRINVCLVYPNTYHVGMSNLGFQGVYGLLNRRDDVVCERAFLPDEGDIGIHRRTGAPVFSLESGRPLERFDIVAFSVSFENDYPNVLRILDLSKIPFLPGERNAYHPLLIAGGVCPSFNPEPLAPVFDAIFIGEAEESLREFLDVYRKVMGQGAEKDFRGALMENAAAVEGVYVPGFYSLAYEADGRIAGRTASGGAPASIKRRCVRDLSLSGVTTAIVTSESEFSGMFLVEAMRGCPWGCRFCLVGHLYSPPRKKDKESIMEEIRTARGMTSKIGLVGPSLTDYPHIREVLCVEGVDFSITSLRASGKSAGLVELLKGHRSVSIAPEAGTERMRRVIRKRVTEEDILGASKLIFDAGIESLRLYFMIGLPTETMEDVSGIVELVKKIRDTSGRGTITLSVSTFVPKPFTPFQWHPMEPLGSVKEKLHFIKKSLRGMRSVRVLHDVPKYAHMQGLFSMGDRRVFPVLKAMAAAEGASDDWMKACADTGVDRDFYISRKKEFGETLPWDFIDAGISKEKLWAEYILALS